VEFERAAWDRTDVRGSLTIRPQGEGLNIEVSGQAFDAREIVSGSPSYENTTTDKLARRAAAMHQAPEDMEPLTIRARLDRVWVSDDGILREVAADLHRGRRNWTHMGVDGLTHGGKRLRLHLQPEGPNRRAIVIATDDAGAALRDFGYYDNVGGGRLQVEGSFDDTDPRQPLSGVLRISDYQVVKAPVLARLLTAAALTGIPEVLAGDGIHFASLEAPFVLTEGTLALHDVRASGTSIGITVKGQADLDRDELALEGTIVPAYALNSVLGKLPVVGSLFTAEEGGGIFAMNYSIRGPTKDPAIGVNPLSVVTPGFLRRMFDVFEPPPAKDGDRK
jgi:hypothetical protein